MSAFDPKRTSHLIAVGGRLCAASQLPGDRLKRGAKLKVVVK